MRRQLGATMDHTDIRGLVTALHRSVAGLHLSSFGDRGSNSHIVDSMVPLTVCRRIDLPLLPLSSAQLAFRCVNNYRVNGTG